MRSITALIVVFFLAGSALAQPGQPGKVIVKFCPPALIDIVTMPTIQGGVEVKLPHRLSWYTEAGIKYLNIDKPDTSFIGSGGFKLKTEIRCYLLPSKRYRRYNLPAKEDGQYVAVNAFYNYDTYNTQINYSLNKDNTTPRKDCFGVRKKVYGLNGVLGWERAYSGRWMLDVYGGVGVRFRYVNTASKEFNPDRDELLHGIDLNIHDIRNKVDSKDGFSSTANLTLGFRIGYRL